MTGTEFIEIDELGQPLHDNPIKALNDKLRLYVGSTENKKGPIIGPQKVGYIFYFFAGLGSLSQYSRGCLSFFSIEIGNIDSELFVISVISDCGNDIAVFIFINHDTI